MCFILLESKTYIYLIINSNQPKSNKKRGEWVIDRAKSIRAIWPIFWSPAFQKRK